MSDISVIEINDDAGKIDVDDVDKVVFDKIDVDKNDVDKIYKRHNGKPITMIEISPNENYLITYSKEDSSIAGWNVKDMDKVQLKFDQTVKIDEDNEDNEYKIESLCVSDDKKLAYIKHRSCSVIDMDNKDKKIALDLDEAGALY
ncbi:hypothetical protein RhiirA4_465572, partial [Rhizophagus irregularis]